jgi:hypothetical protein
MISEPNSILPKADTPKSENSPLLEILSDRFAYDFEGTIQRNHDTCTYGNLTLLHFPSLAHMEMEEPISIQPSF